MEVYTYFMISNQSDCTTGRFHTSDILSQLLPGWCKVLAMAAPAGIKFHHPRSAAIGKCPGEFVTMVTVDSHSSRFIQTASSTGTAHGMDSCQEVQSGNTETQILSSVTPEPSKCHTILLNKCRRKKIT